MENELIIVTLSLILGGAITYIITKHFREKRSLAYEIFCERSLINISPKIKDKIKVEWDGAPLENVSSFKVRLINDGNVAVKKQPILFLFEEGSWIVDWDYSTKPNREFGHIEKIQEPKNPHEVKTVVHLMNPKEEIEFSFLTAESKSESLNIYAKGENLRFHKRLGSRVRWDIASLCVFAAFIGSLVWLLVTKDPQTSGVLGYPVIIALTFPILFFSLRTLIERKFRSKA